ncbi:MAG: hypothetical protein NDJ89_09655 [Oligoflexia bacterium]|nr:hypothetical protein [Oligoflexia bacterium]
MAALDTAFRALAQSDGHVAEELGVAIGKSITKNPETFLKAYQKHAGSVIRLDALVGNLGPAFVDDFRGQAVEIRKRIKALQGVKNKELKPWSANCIQVLKEKLEIVDR